MPNYRIARPTDLIVPATNALSSTTYAEDHPVAELRNHKLWRTFRTAAVGTQRIIWERAAAGALDSIFIGNANFPTFDLHGSADNITYGTTIVTSEPITRNKRTGRRHKWYTIPGGTAPKWIRLTPTGTPDGGVSYYEAAQWTMHTASLLLGDYAGDPLAWNPIWASTHIPLPGGAEEITEDGDGVYLETVIQSPYWLRGSAQTIQGELLDLLHAAGAAGHFVIFENLGDDSQAFLVQRKESDFPVAEQVATFAAGMTLREVV